VDAPLALDTDQAETLAIVVVVALLVLVVVIVKVVSALVGRLVAVVVVAVLIAVVWTQRADIEAAARNCDATFLGIELTPSDPNVKARCQQVTNR
jgi:hypothetical protein